MNIYESSHLFFRDVDDLVYSPKNLGLYYSSESAKQAILYYQSLPGFHENQNSFSIRERAVVGNIIADTVYEILVYLHSEDYVFEAEIELGLYGDKSTAQNKLIKYCKDNASLLNTQNLTFETILNSCVIEKKEWAEGFLISE